jgi:hypothetical protein
MAKQHSFKSSNSKLSMMDSEGPAHEKAESKAKEASEGMEPGEGYAMGGSVKSSKNNGYAKGGKPYKMMGR